MVNWSRAAALLALTSCASAKVYLKEDFNDGWEARWTKANTKGASQGAWGWDHGEYYGDEDINMGLKTMDDYRFYHISAPLDEEFSNEGKDLVLQYSVKHEQKIDCGGGYIKLHPAGIDQENYNGDTEYNIMFGPDICGTGTRKTHVILTRDGENHLIKKEPKCETDEATHVYTLVISPDNTYEVFIDGKTVQDGSLEDDWDLLPPKEIKDPDAKKPSDWVDEEFIDDPEDVKPADWDETPKDIPDPDAVQPDDWDEEEDGEWEPPLMPNPEYKGEWKPKRIPNPAYQGKWVHPMIPNPEYVDTPDLYKFDSLAYVGFDLWQVKSGTIFDSIIVTDSLEEADAYREATWGKTKDGEKAMRTEAEEEARLKREEERKKADEARKRAEEEEEDDYYYDDDEDEKDEL
eukprot:Rmarinus@m.8284